jgi:hypothetical protein
MEFNFGTANIFDLGKTISDKLVKDGIKYKSELFVYVDENDFKKIDEDLYYRNKEDDSDKFIPSDNEIIINFEMVKIIVKKYGSNKD